MTAHHGLSNVMLVMIDDIFTFEAWPSYSHIATRKLVNDKGCLNHEASWASKKSMPYSKVIGSNALRIRGVVYMSFANTGFQPNRQFFNCQWIQSLLLNSPKKSWASATCNRRSISAWVGFLKPFFPEHFNNPNGIFFFKYLEHFNNPNGKIFQVLHYCAFINIQIFVKQPMPIRPSYLN